jgi:thiamine kinase-like enzyme
MSRTARNQAAETELTTVIESWPEWDLPLTGRPKILDAIEGGRTNRNFRLAAPGLDHDLLLRVNHPDPVRLGINRALEREIIHLTAAAGISRSCLYWDPGNRFVLFAWLDARPWTPADLASSVQRSRLWPLIERLGEIKLDRARRNYHAYLHHYWTQLERTGATDGELDSRWRHFEPHLKAFDRSPWPARLVHHDLIPANILDTGQRLYLIDWEYAAPGHPDIDAWSIEPDLIHEPFVAELMGWINDLWERLIRAKAQ